MGSVRRWFDERRCFGLVERGLLSIAGTDPFDGRQETIAAAGESLDEPRTTGRVAEGLSNAVDRGVDPVLVVDESAFWP